MRQRSSKTSNFEISLREHPVQLRYMKFSYMPEKEMSIYSSNVFFPKSPFTIQVEWTSMEVLI